MLGRNHALYGVAGWVAAWPFLATAGIPGFPPSPDIEAFAVTTAVAAGASVIPDLDHPDARPAKHFGVLTKILAKGINKAAGGHRMVTHTAAFAVLLAAVTVGISWLPSEWGAWCAALACGFCCSVGTALVGPSLGFRIPTWADWAIAIGTGWWVWDNYITVQYMLPWLAIYGVTIHILCDAVTKGGVPLLWPITSKRFALSLFRVGGPGEQVASVIGVAGLIGALWYATQIATF